MTIFTCFMHADGSKCANKISDCMRQSANHRTAKAFVSSGGRLFFWPTNQMFAFSIQGIFDPAIFAIKYLYFRTTPHSQNLEFIVS